MARPDGGDESRAAMYGEALPELPAGEMLAEWWYELGYARSGLNGVEPYTWQELQAFAVMGGYDISAIEARCLMDMSRAYCVEIGDSSHFRIAPMERDL